jgi:hypothetical protein
MLTGGICVLQKYNAIHNISIPRFDIDPQGSGRLAAMSVQFVTDVMMPGPRADQVSLGAA